MLSVFSYSLDAVMPILLLILCGYVARRTGFLTEQTAAQINRFNFRFGYFALMFYHVYGEDDKKALPLMLLGITLGIIILLTLIGWAASAFLTKERARRGVLIQSAFRSNYAIIGMMLAETLAGPEGATLVAMFQLPAVIYFNSVSVLAMSLYSDYDQKPSVRSILHTMVTNPLIQGLLTGALVLVIRMHIPERADGSLVFSIREDLPWVYTTFANLSRMCTPLALIVLGATLRIGQARDFMKELVSGVFMRLIMAPAVGFTILIAAERAGLITLTPVEVSMLVSILGSPLATAAAIMAREMGADKDLAAQLVVWTSILSMFTLFVLVAILRGAGLL